MVTSLPQPVEPPREQMVDISTLLESRPGVCGGRLRLRGSRLTVYDVASAEMRGYGIDELRLDHPYIDRSAFHAALAYYYANKAEVEAFIEAEREYGEAL